MLSLPGSPAANIDLHIDCHVDSNIDFYIDFHIDFRVKKQASKRLILRRKISISDIDFLSFKIKILILINIGFSGRRIYPQYNQHN